ncbi:DUF502 domain-containing protein [Flavobacteriaceae bacterium F08102]|nr:DUF502 domain-containing protein [Flavobacteriaceae bacterium F08102]
MSGTKKLINYFLQGILYIAPIGLTLFIIYYIFSLVDGLVQKLLLHIFDAEIPGLGFLTFILVLILVGYLGRTFIAEPIKKVFKNILVRVPLLDFIYTAFNDLFSAFVGKEKKFNQPVMVRVNLNSDLEKLGFITEENLEILGELDKVAVYFPHSYNFSGELFIVPKANIRHLDVNSGEVMKFVVSAGLTGLDKSQEQERNQEKVTE